MADDSLQDRTEAEYFWLLKLNKICDQFERALHGGARPAIEEALRDLSETQLAELLAELLLLKLDYRRRRGETPQPDEYLARFPEHAAVVAAAFRHVESNAAASSNGKTEPTATTRSAPRAKSSRVSVLPANTRIGDFELLEEIGRGGMGVVYKARQISLDRVVAVKMILSGEFADDHEVERFGTEAKAAASLKHPHIVAIYEVGEEAGRHFFAMEYIEGPSLAQIQAEGPLPPRKAAGLIATVAEAVHYAHTRGVVHRDLKPGNLLLDQAGQPHIADFGLARRRENDSHLTSTGQVLGTACFIPPEQAVNDSAAIGPASDVYSLGALLYTLLTGRPPFQAASYVETLNQVIKRDPISPRRLNPAVPRDLEVICLKCLEKHPAQRCQSAAVLAAELRRYLNHEPIHLRKIGRLSLTWRWCRRRPAAAAFVALSVAGLVLFLAGLFLHNRDLAELNSQLSNLNEQLSTSARDSDVARENAERHAQQTADTLYGAEMRLAASALHDHDTRTLTELLNRHLPTDKEQQDRRGFEWYYLRRQASTAHHTLLELDAPQYFVCFSPDRRLIATAGQDAIVRLFDAETEEAIREIVTRQVEVNGLAFTSDGNELATAGDDGSVRIWNVATGTERLKIRRANSEKAFQVAFIPGTTLLACCGEDAVIHLFDTETGEAQGKLVGHDRTIQSLALSEDGQTVISTSSDGTAKLWNLVARNETVTLRGTDRLGPVAVDTRRNLVATGADDGHVQTWRIGDRQELSRVRHLDKPGALAFHPTVNLLAAGDNGGSIRIWELDAEGRITVSEPKTWQAHRGNVYSLAWSADGTRLLSAGNDGRVVNWSLIDDPGYTRVELDKLGAGDFALFPDSSRIARVCGEGLDVWDWRTAKRVTKLDNRWWANLDVSADAKTLAVWSYNGVLGVWNTADWKILSESDPDGYPASGFALSPDARIVAVSRHSRRTEKNEGERSVYLYDAATARIVGEIEAPTCSQLAFASDSQRLAIAQGNGSLLLWNLAEQRLLWRAPQTAIQSLAFSPDGKWLVSAGGNRDAVVWDAKSGTVNHRLVGHRAAIESAIFTADSRTLATGAHDGVIKLWHVATGQELFELPRAEGLCNKLRFTTDGKRLVALIGYKHLLVFHAE